MPDFGFERDDDNGAPPGHHVSGGRNQIPSGGNADGRDIFFAAVQMSRMPMCLTDPHQHDSPLIFVNQAFEQLTGYKKEDIVGKNCRFLQGEATNPETVAAIGTALKEGRDVHEELYNYRQDGTGYWNALFISPVINTEGRLVYHFASQLDVTKRREAEALLHQSQRMETLGGMASSLAHEFNNLMTIVLANLESVASQQTSDKSRRQIERAVWGAQRAARLTDQMLSFARRQFHDDRDLDLNQVVHGLDAILDQMAGTGVRVELDMSPDPLLVKLDAGQLEMALLNLVRNGADAMNGNGLIRVVTRRCTLDGSDGDGAAEVAVVDHGSGMPPEVARRATEPFFTTKEIGKGTGLGLSMVNGFAEQSGGRLIIQTVMGQGTTMRLVFPICQTQS